MKKTARVSKKAFAVFLTALFGAVVLNPLVSRAETLQGITAPNADITLSFVTPGRISEVLVKEGTTVQKNQLLIRLFDEPERLQAEQLKMLSEDRTKILAAKAELSQKKADLKKVEMAGAKGAASDWEIEHLKLNVHIAELSLQSSVLEQAQYRRRYEHALSQLKRMRLVAPIEGLVEDVSVEVGESIGTLGPVMRVVQNDPLWIDVPVPMSQAAQLAVGQDAWITFPDGPAAETPNGRIINIATVADAASDTLRVRIEAPNPMHRPAGERVAVAFSAGNEDQDLAQLKPIE
jgi:multidrug efflux system membrane fusion protein